MDIFFTLDRSGSMYTCVDDTLGGFNSFVDRQKENNPAGNMSLFIFNNVFKMVYQNKKMTDVQPLTREMFLPQGQTALLDAIGETIKHAEKVNTENHKTVVILTDGEENFSSNFTKAHINDLIRTKKEIGKWTFVFLGANQDAIKEAGKLGIPECSAMTFDQQHTQATFESLSQAVTRQVTGESQTVEFTGLERAASQTTPGSPQSKSEVFTGVPHDSVRSITASGLARTPTIWMGDDTVPIV
jgi:hypothetical protein